MIHFTLHQDNKTLFGAEFSILADSGEQYGTVSLDGKMGSMEGVFQIDYHGNTIEMNPVRKQIAKKTLNRDFLHIPFRPYSVSSGNQTGWVYNDKVKLDRGSTRCHILEIGGLKYRLYIVGLGTRGTCAPIYLNSTPIGHIENGCIAERDLHDFSLTLYDELSEDQLFAVLILACYRYVFTFYKPGEVMHTGKVEKTYTTTNKLVLEKIRYLNGVLGSK